MNLKEILETSHSARIDEVAMYQLNIDNYELALEIINEEQDAQLQSFKEQLQNLLSAEKIEQKKAKVMLRVVQQRLKALET